MTEPIEWAEGGYIVTWWPNTNVGHHKNSRPRLSSQSRHHNPNVSFPTSHSQHHILSATYLATTTMEQPMIVANHVSITEDRSRKSFCNKKLWKQVYKPPPPPQTSFPFDICITFQHQLACASVKKTEFNTKLSLVITYQSKRMHFPKQFCIMPFLCALIATTAASPAIFPPIVAKRDDSAIVNIYAGDSCNGNNLQFTVVGTGASVCHRVDFAVGSIQVSGGYVYPCLTFFIWPFPVWFQVESDYHLVAVPQLSGLVPTVVEIPA